MKYECPYCYKPMPDSCPHPSVFFCCGEIGHAVEQKRNDLIETLIEIATDGWRKAAKSAR